MNRLLTKMEPSSDKTHNQSHTGSALLSALLLALFSSGVIADRPSMVDSTESVSNTVNEETMESRPEARSMEAEVPAETPSSVDIMMQQQNQQTYQTGDVVQLPAKEIQPGETLKIRLLDSPRRGMSMDKVQNAFGQPITISDSVGKPPITRWTYADRVVYFEYSTVLHVVAR
ncbi:MAG TPA: hypothetical protein ENJ87_07380 [Gammaproteobacteria bacterium]|nr:hypothetical protein [Gammaproteobacteria bacterium]